MLVAIKLEFQGAAACQRRQCASWITKRKNERFTKLAREEGYRARSAYKLLQLDQQFKLFGQKTKCVVDLGCAPGSWLQAASERMQMTETNNKHLIGIDLQPVIPVPGAILLQGDFASTAIQKQLYHTVGGVAEAMDVPKMSRSDSSRLRMRIWESENTPIRTGDLSMYLRGSKSELVQNHVEERRKIEALEPLSLPCVDGVMSDMAAHDSSIPFSDGSEREAQVRLAEKAKLFSLNVLRNDGWFLAKVYTCEAANKLYQSLSLYFSKIHMLRPEAVQQDSREAFILGLGFIGRERLLTHGFNGLDRDSIYALGPGRQRQEFSKILGIRDQKDTQIGVPSRLMSPRPRRQHLSPGKVLRKHIGVGRKVAVDPNVHAQLMLDGKVPRTR
eukprot:TRINITY_DN9780_c0_g1_i2.p1 TRINITY_DN9780_c0_g1~~TRINITY_DN9780_c0_g1_i2.p1  ORF type:complete len:399 (+),score=61.02 TRINITY_DN9780_c0_g1_i2:34-1197(+)